MRHTFATTAYRKTKDLKAIMDALGHSKVETTMIYVSSDLFNAIGLVGDTPKVSHHAKDEREIGFEPTTPSLGSLPDSLFSDADYVDGIEKLLAESDALQDESVTPGVTPTKDLN